MGRLITSPLATTNQFTWRHNPKEHQDIILMFSLEIFLPFKSLTSPKLGKIYAKRGKVINKWQTGAKTQ
jgi:hypothetical protein